MIRKLKCQKAETIVETLVALLIASLSVMMLTAAIAGSARVNGINKEADKAYSEELRKAETYENSIQNTTVDIVFGNGADRIIIEREVELFEGDKEVFVSYK